MTTKKIAIDRKIEDARLSDLLCSILESVPHAIVGLSDRKIFFANPGVKSVFGWDPEELIGKSSRILYRTEDEWEYAAQRTYPLLENMKIHSGEFFCRHRDGRDLICHLSAARIGNTLNNRRIIVTIEDITHHKHDKTSLEKSERRFREIVELMSDWVWEVNEQERYTFASPGLKKILGYEPEEILGKSLYAFKSPDEVKRFTRLIRPVIKKRKPFAFVEHTRLHRDGRNVFVETSAIPIFNEEGMFTGYRGVSRDITERKRSEREMDKKARDLEDLNRVLKTVLRSIQEEKKEVEERFLWNIKEEILPYVEKVKGVQSETHREVLLQVLEDSLKRISLPFIQKLALKCRYFTPTEFKVASLVKDGKSTKEISEILNVSLNAVELHRYHIRKKLGLKSKKANLQSHLTSLAES
jgi:PAS domain S-box-containing protein